MLNPQWLASFAAVAETGGFTKAAKQLGLTQAAVSQHLRQLEDELGPLILRRPRSVELTRAGEALLDYCGQVELAGRKLRARLSDTEPYRGEISLVSPASMGPACYAFLLELQQAHPALLIRHHCAADPEALEAVLQKDYEFALVTQRPDDPRLVAQAFAYEPLELVVPAGAEVEDWDDLVRLGFIDHPDGQAMATRLLSRRFPDSPGVLGLPSRGFTDQVALVLEPVARGLGCTVIPRHTRQAFARPETVRVVDCGAGAVDILWLIYRAEWPLTSRAAFAIEHLRRRMPTPA